MSGDESPRCIGNVVRNMATLHKALRIVTIHLYEYTCTDLSRNLDVYMKTHNVVTTGGPVMAGVDIARSYCGGASRVVSFVAGCVST